MRLPSFTTRVAALAALSIAPLVATLSRADEVVAVVSIDAYADIKKQLGWIGGQVGNPTLAGFAESFILMATQGKGLGGLDVNRPIGVVVTAGTDGTPKVQGFVPVKDLTKLLSVVQGTLGPAQSVDGVKRIAMPNGRSIDIRDQNGWAVITQAEDTPAVEDPAEFVGPLADTFTVAVQLFPSRMPAAMRNQLKQAAEQASAMAASQGQQVNGPALAEAIESLEKTEMLLYGLTIDDKNDRAFLETRYAAVDGESSTAGRDKPQLTVGSPATADGGAAMVAGHLIGGAGDIALAVEAIERALPAAASRDPITQAIAGLLRDLVGAMQAAGGVDMAITIDGSAATPQAPLPALTLGMRVDDGAAVEKAVKARLGGLELPDAVKVKFDAGSVGKATLHTISIDVSGSPNADRFGGRLDYTLAVAPKYVFLLAGGDVKARIAEVLAASGKPAGTKPPIGDLIVSIGPVLSYAAEMAAAYNPDDPGSAWLAPAAEAAAGQKAAVEFLARPLDRGSAWRISVDSETIKTLAAIAAAAQEAARGGQRVPELVP